MAKVKYDIQVNSGTAAVNMTPKDGVFPAGTEVTFVGTVGTVIKFTKGSPFNEDVDGKELTLPAGPFTVKSAKIRYHFDCGHMVTKNGKQVFEAWPGGGDTPLDK
jgi:hypothetical protein